MSLKLNKGIIKKKIEFELLELYTCLLRYKIENTHGIKKIYMTKDMNIIYIYIYIYIYILIIKLILFTMLPCRVHKAIFFISFFPKYKN